MGKVLGEKEDTLGLCWLSQSEKQQVLAGSWEVSWVTCFTQWVWSPMSIATTSTWSFIWLGFLLPTNSWPAHKPFVVSSGAIRTAAFCVIAFLVVCHYHVLPLSYHHRYDICKAQRAAEMRQVWTPKCSAPLLPLFTHYSSPLWKPRGRGKVRHKRWIFFLV